MGSPETPLEVGLREFERITARMVNDARDDSDASIEKALGHTPFVESAKALREAGYQIIPYCSFDGGYLKERQDLAEFERAWRAEKLRDTQSAKVNPPMSAEDFERGCVERGLCPGCLNMGASDVMLNLFNEHERCGFTPSGEDGAAGRAESKSCPGPPPLRRMPGTIAMRARR